MEENEFTLPLLEAQFKLYLSETERLFEKDNLRKLQIEMIQKHVEQEQCRRKENLLWDSLSLQYSKLDQVQSTTDKIQKRENELKSEVENLKEKLEQAVKELQKKEDKRRLSAIHVNEIRRRSRLINTKSLAMDISFDDLEDQIPESIQIKPSNLNVETKNIKEKPSNENVHLEQLEKKQIILQKNLEESIREDIQVDDLDLAMSIDDENNISSLNESEKSQNQDQIEIEQEELIITEMEKIQTPTQNLHMEKQSIKEIKEVNGVKEFNHENNKENQLEETTPIVQEIQESSLPLPKDSFITQRLDFDDGDDFYTSQEQEQEQNDELMQNSPQKAMTSLKNNVTVEEIQKTSKLPQMDEQNEVKRTTRYGLRNRDNKEIENDLKVTEKIEDKKLIEKTEKGRGKGKGKEKEKEEKEEKKELLKEEKKGKTKGKKTKSKDVKEKSIEEEIETEMEIERQIEIQEIQARKFSMCTPKNQKSKPRNQSQRRTVHDEIKETKPAIVNSNNFQAKKVLPSLPKKGFNKIETSFDFVNLSNTDLSKDFGAQNDFQEDDFETHSSSIGNESFTTPRQLEEFQQKQGQHQEDQQGQQDQQEDEEPSLPDPSPKRPKPSQKKIIQTSSSDFKENKPTMKNVKALEETNKKRKHRESTFGTLQENNSIANIATRRPTNPITIDTTNSLNISTLSQISNQTFKKVKLGDPKKKPSLLVSKNPKQTQNSILNSLMSGFTVPKLRSS